MNFLRKWKKYLRGTNEGARSEKSMAVIVTHFLLLQSVHGTILILLWDIYYIVGDLGGDKGAGVIVMTTP